MRQIKASGAKPGMTIRWARGDISSQCTLAGVNLFNDDRDIQGETKQGKVVLLLWDEEVLVVKEPPQPEEPTAFGARVVAGGHEFLLSNGGRRSWKARLDGNRYSWAEVCGLGPVTIIDADPSWTLPAQVKVAPVVPERIEEWDTWDDVPEGVVVTVPGLFCHYRKNQGAVEFSDPDDDPEWTEPGVRAMPRGYGPWTRVADV